MRSKRDIRLAVSIFIAIAMALIMPGISNAGSLEPPTSAVDGSGNPVPTMTTPPSWSQKLPASERFKEVFCHPIKVDPFVVCDGVLDNETGLVWEKSSSYLDSFDWNSAISFCYELQKGDRKGWHLPTVEQLESLVDTTKQYPALPTGHPFSWVFSWYWSATTDASNTDWAYAVDMDNGTVLSLGKYLEGFWVWCVRGGQGYDAY